jgi:hypothetical protein
VRADAVGVAARARVDAGNWVDAMESFAVKLRVERVVRDDATTRRGGDANQSGCAGFGVFLWMDGD